MEEPSDVFLVEQSLLDHKEAFSLLIERYQVMSLYIVKRYVADEEVARELVQEALLQAYLSLQQLRDGSRFKNWFYGITLHVCQSWLRQRKRLDARQLALTEGSEAEEICLDPEEVVLERELQQIVSEALLHLSPKNREVARLFYYEDLSIQEIARQKHLSLPAIKNRLYKSREQLRHYLQTQYPELATRSVKRHHKEQITMIPLKIALVKQLHRLHTTTVVLSDEREERALPFWYLNLQIELSRMHDPLIDAGRKTIGEPFAIDFLLKLIQELGGSIERIEIDALQEEITYARLHIRGRDGKPALVNTRLDDTLSLAVRLEIPLAINDKLWQRLSVPLKEKEANREQQFETIAAMSQPTSIRPLALPITSQQPRNLNFRDGLKGWLARGLPLWEKRFDMQLDPEVTYQGRPVLRVVLQGEDATNQGNTSFNAISLSHEGFLADTYRGKRMRLVTYCRVREAKEASFEIVVTSPPLQPDSEHYQLLTTRTPLPEEAADWQRQELVVDVPQNASAIMPNLRMVDKGTLWISAIQWEPVDQSVPLTPFYHTPPLTDLQNLDFQQGLDGWFFQSRFCSGNTPQDYAYGTESVDETASARCMSIKAIKEEPRSPLRLQQSIESDNYLGKRVRLRGSLKGSGLVEPASLYMRKGAIQGYVEHCIVSTQDWTPCEMTTFLQEGSYQLEIGLLLNGKGQVWLKDLAFEVVG